jgi:hypothetical protein
MTIRWGLANTARPPFGCLTNAMLSDLLLYLACVLPQNARRAQGLTLPKTKAYER